MNNRIQGKLQADHNHEKEPTMLTECLISSLVRVRYIKESIKLLNIASFAVLAPSPIFNFSFIVKGVAIG